MKTPAGSLWSRILGPVFGKIQWTPPAWLSRLAGSVGRGLQRHPRSITATLLLLAVAGWGGWKWKKWHDAKEADRLAWELAHRARPDKVDIKIVHASIRLHLPGAPSLGKAGTYVDEPLTLEFSAGVAPLAAILPSGGSPPPGKSNDEEPQAVIPLQREPSPGLTLEPPHPGKWVWENEKHLFFRPSAPWPAGVEYKLAIADSFVFRPEVRLKDREYKFKTAPLTTTVSGVTFYTDPTNPNQQQIVAEINFSHPITSAAEVEKHIVFTVVGGTPIYNTPDGKTPSPLFSLVTFENDPLRHFWARSVPVTIPVKEDFALVTVTPGMTIAAGGKPMEKEASGRVRVPDVSSGLSIAEAQTQLARNDEGEPAQILLLNTKGYAVVDALAKHMDVRVVPPKEGDDPVWQSAEEVPADIAAKGTPVKFTVEPDEEKFTLDHAFRLDPTPPGQLLVTVKKGLSGAGGFILPADFRALLAVPEFPRELSFTGRGGLLALNGERKLAVKARRVSHIRYTLARVKEEQLNHLVSMTRGNFESPYFRGAFGRENISRIRTEVVKLEKQNDYEAVWSAFDFTPATSAPGAADNERGLFFLTAEAVRPRPKDERGEPILISTEEADEDEVRQQGNDPDWIMENVSPAPGTEDEDGERRPWNSGPSRFVLVTDLGLLVKQNADASRDIFVQSVSKGGPVAGVEISILAKNGDTIAQAQTDADGHARFDAVAHLQRDLAPVAIVARLEKDLAFMPWQRQDRVLDLSRFDTGGVPGSETQALDAFLFTERGIFRPGDKVHFGISVRPRGWEAKVEGVPVTLEVRTPAGQVCSSVELKLPADGFLEADATLNENDPTGLYSARLLLGEEQTMQIGRVHFRVEDFQPDRMKLAVALPGAPAAGWRKNPDIKGTVDLKTLFGFPAADRRVTGKVVVSPAHFHFPEFEGYSFYRYLPEHIRWPRDNEWSLGEITTDENGSGTFDLDMGKMAGASVAFTFYAEAFEADGGRSVAESQSGIYSPLDEVIGYKADGELSYIGQDAPRSLQLICVGPDGKAKAAPPLTAQIMETRFHSVLTRQKSGSYAYTSTRRETTVSENPLVLPAEGLAFALPVNKTGNFHLKLLAEDKTVRLAVAFSIAGKGESGRSLEQNAELEMNLAREEWKSGEEIECSLSAPFTGAGLLTIEREKVLAWKWFRSGATDSVQKIKVPDSIEGSAYVSASFVRALDSPEAFMSPLSYAVAPFRANMGKRRNDILLDSPPVVVPGAPMKIGFRSAAPQRAVVYAVDEGIHQITNYELPQPLDFFLRKRSLEVQTLQILDLILPEFTVLGRTRAFGGDGEDEGAVNMTLNPFKRRREPPVVYWSGIIETGPERREVEYAVPDYFAGQLTIMAVAAGGSSMGSAQTKTLVRGPFVLSPNSPLFAAPGDTFTASLTIANNTAGLVATATDQVRATLRGSDNLEIVASPDVTMIPIGKEGTVRFKVKAREPLGNATLTFRTEAGGISSERAATLSIRPVSPRMTTLQSGWFRTPEHQVKTARLMHNEFADRRTSVSSLPLNLAAGLEKWLHEFPHGCTEQIVSRAMARTILSDDAAFGFDRAAASKDMDAVFAMLRARQMPDGEFGLWGRSRDGGIEFLTPYVTHFLTEAKEAGFAVPPDLLQNSLKRLRVQAAMTPNPRHERAIVARTIYLLTRNGEVTTNYLLNLRDFLEKDEKETWQAGDAAPWMACTYAMLKKEDDAKQLITAWREAKRKAGAAPAWDYYYEQSLAREATMLMLLSRHFPDIAGKLNYDDLKPITRGIERSEFNTYSAASCVMALKAWVALQKQSNIFTSLHEVTPGAEARLLGPVGSGLVNADFTAAAQGIQFGIIRPEGAPDMGAYWQIVESGFDSALPTEPVREGLEVMRAFMDAGREATTLKVGDGVDIRIGLRNLTGKAQRDIALVDLLPCGFEVESGSLNPGPNGTPGADSVDVREDRNIFYCTVAAQQTLHFRYRVKPVCAGTFTVPPASASSMYDHTVHARGLPSTITVSSRE